MEGLAAIREHSRTSLQKMSVGPGFRPQGTIPLFHLVPIIPAGRSLYLKK